MQPTMNGDRSKQIQAVNESEGNNNYPSDSPVAQILENRAMKQSCEHFQRNNCVKNG